MTLEERSEYWSESFININFSGTEISFNEFERCTFKGCDFSEATFNRCNFVDCEFINCNLSVIKIKYSSFSDVSFRESKLIGINWTNAFWPKIMLNTPIKFYKSIVNDSSFYGISLQGLVLEECKAHNVDFRSGDFSNSIFRYTDLTGCLFASTNLSGSDFSEATNYEIDIYKNIIKRAMFSRFEAVRLLESLEIELMD